MLNVRESQVYIYSEVCDMRCGFDRLSDMVSEKLKRQVASGGLYVFWGRRKDRVKILYWDRDGYCLWYKRLEAGVFKIDSVNGLEEISGVDLELLLSGMELSRIKYRKSILEKTN